MLGGSSRRHVQGDARSGMLVYFLADSGAVEQGFVASVGEIYDILPWDDDLMRNVAQQILAMPKLPLEGDFPPLCAVTF